MKNDINLAYKRPVDTKATKNALYALLILVLVGALGYAAVTIPNIFKKAALDQSAALDAQLETLSGTAQQFDQMILQKQTLSQNVDMLKELNSNKKDMAALINDIQSVCPQDITLQGLQFNADGILINGLAKSDLELSTLAFNLRSNKEYAAVNILSTEIVEKSEMQKFSILLRFASPLKAEPITLPSEDEKKADKTNNNSTAQPSATQSGATQTDSTSADGKEG
jgi:Tfp pilus assembly protein PilN